MSESRQSPVPVAHRSRILLIGMMGAGKSHAGAMVASRMGWPYLDSDEQVQRTTGNTVAQIFASRGEAAFRAEEAAALAAAVTGSGPAVVSVAGGAVLSADNRRLLRQAGLVVWLRAEISTIAARIPVAAGGDHRPLLAGDRFQRLTLLYEERRPQYQALADVVIDVDHLTPGEVADQVVAAFHAAATGAVGGGAASGGPGGTPVRGLSGGGGVSRGPAGGGSRGTAGPVRGGGAVSRGGHA